MPFIAFGPLLLISLKFRGAGGSLISILALVQLIALSILFKDKEGSETLKFIAQYILPQFLIGLGIYATKHFDTNNKINKLHE